MAHTCRAFVLNCIDFRFWESLVKYLKDNGVEKFDYAALAGGAKSVVDEASRPVVMKQLEVSVGLHKVQEIYLVNHIDCGAYGGSAAFGSLEEERNKLIEDLKQAAGIIREKYPEVEVKLLLNNWEKMEKI